MSSRGRRTSRTPPAFPSFAGTGRPHTLPPVTSPPATSHPTGRRVGLAGGSALGVRLGTLFGVVDALVSWTRQEEPIGGLDGLGCVAAAALSYACLGALAGAVSGLVLSRRSALLLGLAAGLFLEAYWWTRPLLFWGLPATSPERLATSVALLVGALCLAGLAVRRLSFLGTSVPTLVASVVLSLAGAGYLGLDLVRRSDRSVGAISGANEDLPNVLLVVVDALRHDVLGAYGNERVETPVMDGLAKRGVLFQNAFVQAPFTWSSFGSILTGKYPRRHGMLKLDPKYRWARDINVTLPLHLKTARQKDGRRLEDRDWVGAAFMTGTVTRDSGLLHGFDLYCETLIGHDLVLRSSAWSRFKSEVLLFKLVNKATQRVDYNKAATTAIEWFETESDRRFVAFLHLYSTHTPYDPEPEFRDMYVDPDYDGPIRAFYAEHRYAIEAGDYLPTPADVEQIRNLYYAGTTQADAAIGAVLDVLREKGVLDDTLVILTSDHGEELGEHGVFEHNWMYQTNLRIPLIMTWPGGLPASVRVNGLVETVDILPTVSDLLGLVPPGPEDGAESDAEYLRLDGKSLLPLVRGELEELRQYVFAESGSALAIQDRATKLVISRECLELEPGDPGWDEARRDPELYDLAADPDETVNLFGERVEDTRRLLGALREWDATLPIPREDVISSHRDLEAQELMDSLGYVGGIGDEDE